MRKESFLTAPVKGKCIDIKEVPDKMFADKVMGEGMAFEYQGNTVYSPCDGTIEVVALSKHAIGIKSDAGLEILIHVGIDTVDLKGEGFRVFVRKDQKVKRGARLLEINREFMLQKNINLITPLIIMNHKEFDFHFDAIDKDVEFNKTKIVSYIKKEEKIGEGEIMKYENLCNDIINYIGGQENVVNVTHCITRLRFKLKDESKVNKKELDKTDGVMQVIFTGGQCQIVIGPHVEQVYKDLIEIGGFNAQSPIKTDDIIEEKKGILAKFLVLMSGIFQPVLSVLMASGMIKAFLQLTILAGWMTADNSTYVILSAIGDALFYFFPVALGWSCAKKFGLKEIYGITIGACLVYPSIVALSSGDVLYTLFKGTMFQVDVLAELFGLPVILPMQTYASSVIPIIFIVYVASKIYKFLDKKLPSMIKSFFVPLITLLVSVPIGLLVVGPIAMFIQNILAQFIQLLININPGVAGLFVGSLWSILVMFGLHMAIIPMFAINVAQYGYDIINPLLFPGACACMGAVIGIILKTKSLKEKNIAVPALISTFFGVNEPTLYGVLIPRRKVMITCFASAGIGAAIAGFCGSKLYAFGSSSVLSLPCYLNPQGIDIGFIGLCIGSVVAFVVALIAAVAIGSKRDDEIIE